MEAEGLTTPKQAPPVAAQPPLQQPPQAQQHVPPQGQQQYTPQQQQQQQQMMKGQMQAPPPQMMMGHQMHGMQMQMGGLPMGMMGHHPGFPEWGVQQYGGPMLGAQMSPMPNQLKRGRDDGTPGSGGRSDGTSTQRRKESHNATEQKRRQKINDKMTELKDMLPNCRENNADKPTIDKATILGDAIEHIRKLQYELEMANLRKNELERLNKELQDENEAIAREAGLPPKEPKVTAEVQAEPVQDGGVAPQVEGVAVVVASEAKQDEPADTTQ